MEKQPHKSARVFPCMCFPIYTLHCVHCTNLGNNCGVLIWHVVLIFDYILILFYASFHHASNNYPLLSPPPSTFANQQPNTHSHTYTFTHMLSSPQKLSQVKLHRCWSRQTVNCICSVSDLQAICTRRPSFCLSLLYSL